ncbi:alpha/beta hydrolase [Dactylosporangium sp. NPDC049525]|uniref:alpha/beta hydrolase n=1 Tax=Dactylosporangium sp. NPDC049525 TaxID=3154730 RepID=UPI00341D47A9
MTTYLLVHGAWHGAWSWDPVAAHLREAGHEVVAPTLAGLAERADLIGTGPGLATHVADVVAAAEGLDDLVLVGHSYAGMVAVGAAVQLGNRVRRVVIVDGFLPEAGEQAIDLLPPHAAKHYRESVIEIDGAKAIPPRPLANLGVTDRDLIDVVTPRLTPQPARTYFEDSAGSASAITAAGTYLLCAGWNTPFEPYAERAASLGWHVERIDADHEVPLTDPALLVRALTSSDVKDAVA